MLPVIIFVVVAIPLLVIGFLVVQPQQTHRASIPTTETDADRARTEHEFAEAEEYQEEWREQNA